MVANGKGGLTLGRAPFCAMTPDNDTKGNAQSCCNWASVLTKCLLEYQADVSRSA